MSDIDIVIRCKCKCGASLLVTNRETDSITGLLTITVEPCQDCLESERSEGYHECERDYDL